MNVKKAYDSWSDQYDSNENKTRDLEAIALRSVLKDCSFDTCLEIGCGTGKNTAWLHSRCSSLTAIDFSEEMLAKAKQKIRAEHVRFIQADITKEWDFATEKSDLVSFSLVLEHIEDLDSVFRKVASCTKPGSLVYLGELHPFKQYSGSKARFETPEGTQVVTCFDHHISDFTDAAGSHGFRLEVLNEFFDEPGRKGIPRILALLFKKE